MIFDTFIPLVTKVKPRLRACSAVQTSCAILESSANRFLAAERLLDAMLAKSGPVSTAHASRAVAAIPAQPLSPTPPAIPAVPSIIPSTPEVSAALLAHVAAAQSAIATPPSTVAATAAQGASE